MEKMRTNLRDMEQSSQDIDLEDDSASNETRWITTTSLITKEKKLLDEVDAALRRLEEGTYGYCEETHDPISIERLEAYPMARLSIEEQKKREIERGKIK